jgi:hypothetical protein
LADIQSTVCRRLEVNKLHQTHSLHFVAGDL